MTSRTDRLMRTLKYQGFEIDAQPQLLENPRRWKLSLRMVHRYGELVRERYFSTAETFATEEAAIEGCLEYGRQLIDGAVKGVARSDLP